MPKSGPATSAFNLAALITLINVLVALGFSVAGIITSASAVAPAGSHNAALVFALYAAARAVAIAGCALVVTYRRASGALLLIGALAGVIQLLDAGVGLVQADIGKTAGPLVIAALEFWALRRLSRVEQ